MSETTPRHEWRIVADGTFNVFLDAHADAPAFLGAFAGGAGCNPATITAADAGLVAWYAELCGSPLFDRSFADVRAAARSAWVEVSETEADHARRAADPHEPEPFIDPWWAPRDADYAGERAASHGEG